MAHGVEGIVHGSPEPRQVSSPQLLAPAAAPGSRSARLGNWLISTATWVPLLAWAVWPLFDARLEQSPWVAGLGALGLAVNWVYAGWSGARDKAWTALLGAGALFAASYSVAARSQGLGTFVVVGTLVRALANSLAGGLAAGWALNRAVVRSYSLAEQAALRTVMLGEMATMAGVTAARLGDSPAAALIGLAGGVLLGGTLSWFVFAPVYATMNVVLTLVVEASSRVPVRLRPR